MVHCFIRETSIGTRLSNVNELLTLKKVAGKSKGYYKTKPGQKGLFVQKSTLHKMSERAVSRGNISRTFCARPQKLDRVGPQYVVLFS